MGIRRFGLWPEFSTTRFEQESMAGARKKKSLPFALLFLSSAWFLSSFLGINGDRRHLVSCMDVEEVSAAASIHRDRSRSPTAGPASVTTSLDLFLELGISAQTKLKLQGIAESVMDLAAYTSTEITAEVGMIPDDELLSLLTYHAQAVSLKQLRLAAVRSSGLAAVLPASSSIVQISSWSRPAAAVLRGRPKPLPAESAVAGQRLLAAADLLKAFLLTSGVSESLHMEKALSGDKIKWQQQYATALAERFELSTLKAQVRVLSRGSLWQQLQPLHFTGTPSALTLRLFLQDQAHRGATAAQSAFRALGWLNQNLAADFPISSAMCVQFSTPVPGHVVTHAKELPLQAWPHLLTIGQQAGVLGMLARLVARVLLSDLRFVHVQRAAFRPALSNLRSHIWQISKGKHKKEPFSIAIPTYAGPNEPVFQQLQLDMDDALPEHSHSIMMPDIFVDRGQALHTATFLPQHMKYGRFVVLCRALCAMKPLSLQPEELDAVSTYSLRRWLPTIADGLQLPIEERGSLGNWCDSTGQKLKEPMAVRYSALRMEAVAQVRRVCIAAVSHLLKHVPNASMDRLTSVAKFLPQFRDQASSQEWGPFGGTTFSPECLPAPDEVSCPSTSVATAATAIDSSDSSSSSPSESDDDAQDEPTIDNFQWIAPRYGLVHVKKDENLLMPFCRKIELKPNCDQGVGFDRAALLNRPWCPACIICVPGLTDKVLGDA